MLQAEAHHRDHAIVEPVFSDLADGPLAHMPSGDFNANAAWVTLTLHAPQHWHAETACLALHAAARAPAAAVA